MSHVLIFKSEDGETTVSATAATPAIALSLIQSDVNDVFDGEPFVPTVKWSLATSRDEDNALWCCSDGVTEGGDPGYGYYLLQVKHWTEYAEVTA